MSTDTTNNPLLKDIDPDAVKAYDRYLANAVDDIEATKEHAQRACAEALQLRSMASDPNRFTPDMFDQLLLELGHVVGMLDLVGGDRQIADIDRLTDLNELAPRIREHDRANGIVFGAPPA